MLLDAERRVIDRTSFARLESVTFYDNIDIYHKKVDKILKLISDYFDHKKTKYIKEYMAIRIASGSIVEMTDENITNEMKHIINVWDMEHSDKVEEETIYTIEFSNKIFFFKAFQFKENNFVLAGYTLTETALVRTFLSLLSEQKIREKYERMLAIF